jgi:hypothetical protein
VTTALENVHIVPVSGNGKTGSIPVTYRPMDTCPTDCPFLPTGSTGGCYGTGYLFGSARKYSSDTTVEAATDKLQKGVLKTAKYLRDRVVGDVLTPEGEVDTEYITGIASAADKNGVIPFGYTHAWRKFTPEHIGLLGEVGYVMNASTETLTDAAEAINLGLPAVIVDDETPDGTMVAGMRLITCPAETRKDVTCASCGLCAKPLGARRALIRFRPHGNARRKALVAIASMNERKEAV